MHKMWHLAFSIGLGVSIPILFVVIYKVTSDKAKRFAVRYKVKHNKGIESVKKDTLDKWISLTEKNIKQTGFNINLTIYVISSIALSALAFILSMYYFKNLTASLLLAASFFVIPEHILTIVAQKRKDKMKEQMIATIRIFTAEFLQTPQLERGFKAVGKRVKDPVGSYFRKAHMELVMGTDAELVLSRLAGKIDDEYGRMFIQLLKLAKNDSTISSLFTELLEKIESNIELNRKNHSNLTGERVLALIMTCIPIPAYFVMLRIVPETSYFLAETLIGRMIITIAFGSMLVWAVLDRITGKVEA